MTLKDFYISNDMINDYPEITVHPENLDTYDRKIVNPLTEETFSRYLDYTVTHFCMDESGHWHLEIHS